MTIVFIPRESRAGETRVAATPETTGRMVKRGLEVHVETGAGEFSFFDDSAYAEAGATIVSSIQSGLEKAEVVLKVAPPTLDEVQAMRAGQILISFFQGVQNPEVAKALQAARVTAWGMELVPRTTLAQKMDALSSQANIGGYKAVLIGACALGKYFPLLMTAAGTVKPARVVIFGVGVAGLQAIATAKRLGAVVEATDIRPEVKEQVESLGAKFIEVKPDEGAEEASVYAKEASDDYKRRQAEAVAASVANADLVITTAQVPGKKAPVLIPLELLETMKPGSVVVDLAVEQGGNCALSEVGKHILHKGVTIVGTPNLPATMPINASELYSRNLLDVIKHLVPDPEEDGATPTVVLNLDDEIIGGSIAIHEGVIRHEMTAKALEAEGAPQS